MGASDMVLRGRLRAEALMLDSCTVTRQISVYTDPGTGTVTPTYAQIYSGPCKVQQTIAQSSSPEAGGHKFTVLDTRLDLPVSVGPVAIDDAVTLDASVLDSQLVGRVYRVTEIFHKSMATAQRTRVEEVVA